MNWKDKRILIVEDDQLSSRFLTTVLRDSKADLLYAKNGIEAVDLVKQNGDLDLILMDVQLPGMSGNEAASKIRQFNERIPIIAQTAHAMSEDKDRSINSGCDDYITKPINISLLMDKISQYI
ncbi:MAG: response regulator [Bacteroidales bacterium]|nr:response regulator [Bacteroidales bacterium]